MLRANSNACQMPRSQSGWRDENASSQVRPAECGRRAAASQLLGGSPTEAFPSGLVDSDSKGPERPRTAKPFQNAATRGAAFALGSAVAPPHAPCVRVVLRQCGAPPALPSRLTRPMAVGSARCGNWSPVRAPCASERRHVAVGFRAVPTEGWLGCLITRWPSSPDCGSPLRRAMRDAQAPRVSARGCT